MPTHPTRPFVAEAGYPATYRDAEIRQIVRATRAGHSTIVSGLGGSGKSHLLRFLAFHPSLPERVGTPDLVRLYLDCNAAITDDSAAVFRALLLETGSQADVPTAASAILAALRTTLAERMTERGRYLIILDRFERIPATVQPDVLDGLRHVRDYLGRRVSYVLGSRTPPPIAELSEEFEDLLAAPPVVWIGPLGDSDVAWNVGTILGDFGVTPDDRAIMGLARLSGGHPRLLRAATIAWSERAPADPLSLIDTIAADQQVARICEAIMRELDDADLALLQQIAQDQDVSIPPTSALRRFGLVRDPDGAPVIASLLLERSVRGVQFVPQLDLTALEQRLWELLQAQPDTLIRRTELIDTLYGDNPDGINDEALTALVARLRRKLHGANVGTIEAVRGLGYRFIPAPDTDGLR